MNTEPCPYGFRVLGNVMEERRLIDHAAAFHAYAECDPKAECGRESYLSAFQFCDDFRAHMEQHRTPKGFAGACWSDWLWFDLDGDDLDATLADARKLASFILYRYSELNDDDLLLWFSGSKGFHIGVPLVHRPPPSPLFHLTCRKLAERLADDADGIRIDAAIYDRQRCFRAPNSKHPKSGLHKRRLMYQELLHLDAATVRNLAREPTPFDIPQPASVPPLLASDWNEAATEAAEQANQRATIYLNNGRESGRLRRATLDFIRKLEIVSSPGDGRTTRLFRAAGNLTEHGAPAELVHALLTEAALDYGLPPAEVERVIGCGIANSLGKARKSEGGGP